MLPREHLAKDVMPLLENLYLASAGEQAQKYAMSSEIEKRTILRDFAKNQAMRSKRWATIAQNLLSADLDY